jgi:PKD repeat protein
VDSSIQTVVIPKKPTADFNMNSTICVNEELSVLNNSADADNYFWDFGNSMTSNLQNPLAFSYNLNGNFDILLVAYGSGCTDSLTKTVVVNPNPEALFGYSEICNGTRLADSSIDAVSHFWDFGDGNTSIVNDIDHIYGSAGNYQVKLKVTNSFGCSDSNIQSIIIPEAPIADFSIDSVVCANEELTIVNGSTDADAFFWYSGGSKISELKNPLAVSFPVAATYDIKLVAIGSSCKDSLTKTILVNPNPIARIGFDEICLGARFIDSTLSSTERMWDFGDGSTSTMEEIEHLYNSPGTYPVKLVVNNSFGCADSTSEAVLVQKTLKLISVLIQMFVNYQPSQLSTNQQMQAYIIGILEMGKLQIK